MESRKLTAVIELGDSGRYYVAHCPELGTASQGDTPDEAFANLKDATETYLDAVSGSVQVAEVREFVLA